VADVRIEEARVSESAAKTVDDALSKKTADSSHQDWVMSMSDNGAALRRASRVDLGALHRRDSRIELTAINGDNASQRPSSVRDYTHLYSPRRAAEACKIRSYSKKHN